MSASYHVEEQRVNIPDIDPNNDSVGCCVATKHTLVDCKEIVIEACCPSRKRVIKILLFLLAVMILGLLAEMRASMSSSRVAPDVVSSNSTDTDVTTVSVLWTD